MLISIVRYVLSIPLKSQQFAIFLLRFLKLSDIIVVETFIRRRCLHMGGELYTVSEAAEYLKLSTKTVLRLISDKKILASKVSNRSWRIKESDIDDYLKSNSNGKKGAKIK